MIRYSVVSLAKARGAPMEMNRERDVLDNHSVWQVGIGARRSVAKPIAAKKSDAKSG
jgi:hypothetical protein